MIDETRDEQLFRKLLKVTRMTRMKMGGGCHRGQGMPGHGEVGPHGIRFMGHGPLVPPEMMENDRPGEDGPHHEGCHGMGMHGHRAPLSRERILSVIADAQDGIHQKEIAEQLHINPSSTSEFIDRLEDDGYLERRTDPDDKRATLLYLTEKGQARAAEVKDERAEGMRDIFSSLSEEEKETLNSLLDKILLADTDI